MRIYFTPSKNIKENPFCYTLPECTALMRFLNVTDIEDILTTKKYVDAFLNGDRQYVGKEIEYTETAWIIFKKDRILITDFLSKKDNDWNYAEQKKCFLNYSTMQKILEKRIQSSNSTLNVRVLKESNTQYPPTPLNTLFHFLSPNDPNPIQDDLQGDPHFQEHIDPLNFDCFMANYFPKNWNTERIIKAGSEAKKNSKEISLHELNGLQIKSMLQEFFFPDKILKGTGDGIEMIIWAEARLPNGHYFCPLEYHGEAAPPDSENFEDLPTTNN